MNLCSEISLRKTVILVAESNDAVRLLIGEQLMAAGHEALLVTNARQVIGVLTKGLSIHMLIMGNQLPELTALELLSCLRQTKLVAEGFPVLLMSGNPDAEEVADRARKMKADFLRKPYERAELISAVTRAVGSAV